MSVIGILAVLAEVMFVQEFTLHRRNAGVHGFGMKCHKGQLFQNHGIVDSIMGIGSPSEWAVTIHQNSRHLIRVDAASLNMVNLLKKSFSVGSG